jgi:hypothetical protein
MSAFERIFRRPNLDRQWKWPLILIMTVVAGFVVWGLFRIFGIFGFVFAAPVIGWVGGFWLIEGAAAGLRWLQWVPLSDWHGKYYAFEGHHIRCIELDGGLWAVDKDVLAVIGLSASSSQLGLYEPDEYARITDTAWSALSEAGVRRLLSKSAHPSAKKFLYWFTRDVYAPYANRRAREAGSALAGTHPAIGVTVDTMPTPPALQRKPAPPTNDSEQVR